MLKKCFYSIPWGYFICFSTLFLGIGVLALLFWLGSRISSLAGVIGMLVGFLLDVLIVPFGFFLGEEVTDYFKDKLQ